MPAMTGDKGTTERPQRSRERPTQTKIIATLGPASSSPEAIRTMIEAGVCIFRLNFSHGDTDTHATCIRDIREQASALDTPVAIMGDLQGPKIRLGTVTEGGVLLSPGAQGGFHVWTAPRFKGAMGTLYLDRQARRVEDGLLVLRASRMVLEVPEDALESWWREEQAIPSFMCPPPLGVQIYDSQIEFTFEMRNEDEELLASDSLILTPRCPQGDEGLFCRSTCEG